MKHAKEVKDKNWDKMNLKIIKERTKLLIKKQPAAKCGEQYRFCSRVSARQFDDQVIPYPLRRYIVNSRATNRMLEKSGGRCKPRMPKYFGLQSNEASIDPI